MRVPRFLARHDGRRNERRARRRRVRHHGGTPPGDPSCKPRTGFFSRATHVGERSGVGPRPRGRLSPRTREVL
ncbi:hypothetical protein A33M_0919 [Rhodovulum sp. PH10]|nr:hypothetical protein A33M_0919 [Rhodovulum sp. PH10]